MIPAKYIVVKDGKTVRASAPAQDHGYHAAEAFEQLKPDNAKGEYMYLLVSPQRPSPTPPGVFKHATYHNRNSSAN